MADMVGSYKPEYASLLVNGLGSSNPTFRQPDPRAVGDLAICILSIMCAIV